MPKKGKNPIIKLTAEEKRQRNADRCKKRYASMKGVYSEKSKTYRQKNEYVLKLKKLEYYAKNKDSILPKLRAYAMQNRASVNKGKTEWQKAKYKSDFSFKTTRCLRERVRSIIKGNLQKNHPTAERVLGCNADFFKGYIESKFEIGMTWGNHGTWEIDHIIPCVAFDLSNFDQIKECFHYSNLQPLWKQNNSTKSDYMPNGQRARNKNKEVAL